MVYKRMGFYIEPSRPELRMHSCLLINTTHSHFVISLASKNRDTACLIGPSGLYKKSVIDSS